MPRRERFNVVGYPQHVIQRGNNRQDCFINVEDREFYKECLLKACQKYDAKVHAYVLMTNHVHLAMTPFADFAISLVMQSLGRRYVRYFNHQYRRTGTLWEGRYKSSLVDTDNYMLTLMKYIELNPVRAGMVVCPENYRWSSYRHHAYGQSDELVSVHVIYEELGTSEKQRQQRYRDYFKFGCSSFSMKVVRESSQHELVTGSEQFKDDIEIRYGFKARLGQSGRPVKNKGQ